MSDTIQNKNNFVISELSLKDESVETINTSIQFLESLQGKTLKEIVGSSDVAA